MTVYRQKILLAYNFLEDAHEELFSRLVNVGMTGEMAHINQVFKAGDTFTFHMEQFRGTSDVNLNKLVAFYDLMEILMNSLATINAITEEELDEMRKDME